MLAKLFSKPANILVLDEPTNDLDVETLELLEEQLAEFAGTVIVISHDREFLDNVITETVFLDGSGKVREFVGGYTRIGVGRAVVSHRKRPAIGLTSRIKPVKASWR